MNTPLATYRFYGENLHARKIHLYYKEMKYWIKKNELKLLRNFDLTNLKKYLLKLRFKTFFNSMIIGASPSLIATTSQSVISALTS